MIQWVAFMRNKSVFDQFLKFHMKMLLGDLNTEVGKEDIFKPTVQNKSLHEINNDRWQLVTQLLTDQNTQGGAKIPI